jgi:hypothetical protein
MRGDSNLTSSFQLLQGYEEAPSKPSAAPNSSVPRTGRSRSRQQPAAAEASAIWAIAEQLRMQAVLAYGASGREMEESLPLWGGKQPRSAAALCLQCGARISDVGSPAAVSHPLPGAVDPGAESPEVQHVVPALGPAPPMLNPKPSAIAIAPATATATAVASARAPAGAAAPAAAVDASVMRQQHGTATSAGSAPVPSRTGRAVGDATPAAADLLLTLRHAGASFEDGEGVGSAREASPPHVDRVPETSGAMLSVLGATTVSNHVQTNGRADGDSGMLQRGVARTTLRSHRKPSSRAAAAAAVQEAEAAAAGAVQQAAAAAASASRSTVWGRTQAQRAQHAARQAAPPARREKSAQFIGVRKRQWGTYASEIRNHATGSRE